MLAFLKENLSTIIIGLIVLAVVVSLVVKLIRDKKNGKSSCSCGCEHCAASDVCHKK